MTVYCVLLHEKKVGLSKLPGPVVQVTLTVGTLPLLWAPLACQLCPSSWLSLWSYGKAAVMKYVLGFSGNFLKSERKVCLLVLRWLRCHHCLPEEVNRFELQGAAWDTLLRL